MQLVFHVMLLLYILRNLNEAGKSDKVTMRRMNVTKQYCLYEGTDTVSFFTERLLVMCTVKKSGLMVL
jgi:hypothetical protein